MNKMQTRFEDVQEFTKDGITVIVMPEQQKRHLIGAKGVYILFPEQGKPISEHAQKAFEVIQSGSMQALECPENPLLLNKLRKEFQHLHAIYKPEQRKSAHTAATVVNARKITSIQTYQKRGAKSTQIPQKGVKNG